MNISFDMRQQKAFARASGDYNSMHIDEIYARRTMYGLPVVHGVNLVLTALNVAPKKGRFLKTIDVRFLQPVFVNEIFTVTVGPRKNDRVIYEIRNEVGPKARVIVEFSEGETGAAGSLLRGFPPREDRAVVDAYSPSLSGSFDLYFDAEYIAEHYANLCTLPPRQLAALMALTRLVGMKCPGEYSIFSEFTLSFETPAAGGASSLNWKVKKYDDRFRLVEMSITSDGFHGIVKAFDRPRPSPQPTMKTVSASVAGRAKTDAKILVVGGSRGLGEVTAKILAARGGEVLLTYRSGGADAKRVVDEITAQSGRVEAVELDVEKFQPGDSITKSLDSIDAMFYFASPPIFRGGKVFSPPLFQEFIRCYVTDFERLVRFLNRGGKKLTVFYPSTIAVDEKAPKMMEYTAAKIAGEELCRSLEVNSQNLNIVIDRLPRLPTDQTQTLIDIPFTKTSLAYMNDVVDVVLKSYAR